ncbi:MAG: indole-3-glycerol phosphate synthase TrpC [Chloroflexota bacterium]
MKFVNTDTILDKILAHKREELLREFYEEGGPLDGGTAWRAQVAHYAQQAAPPRDFLAALQKATVALIAEVKKASPSKGVLIEDFDPVRIGTTYAEHGAAAISVLTDEQFFQGHLRYLTAVRSAVDVPVLRKDFIIDVYQIDQSRAAGADAVLLIVAALDDAQLADLYAYIREYDMHALVEVHNEAEMERALRLGAPLIGVNNRDLKTFNVDLETTARLARLVPDNVTLVAESGINTAADVTRMGQLGARAVLVGEALVRAADAGRDLGEVVRAFSAQQC